MMNIAEMKEGYRERMRRLALFDPLHELDRKQVTDVQGTPIDMKGLGLMTLLFFFEQKMLRMQRAGRRELSEFLFELLQEANDVQKTQTDDIAATLLRTFRPEDGKKRTYEFFNWETNQNEEIPYTILKAEGFDRETHAQYYTLDDDGLELLFATKEFYSEFQLSIHQLMVRNLLKKGEFRHALRQMNEMRVNVEALHERMVKLRHEVQRNIVSEETFERYEQLLDDISERMQRENEEFEELRQFVQETRAHLYEEDFHKQESKAYHYLLEMTKTLELVHFEHTTLLEQSVDLKNHTLRAAQESLYHTGLDAFNFDMDIAARIITQPLDPGRMKGVVMPFTTVSQVEMWSPLAVFAEQARLTTDTDNAGAAFHTAGSADENAAYQTTVQNHHHLFMQWLLQAVHDGCETTTDVIHNFRTNGLDHLFHERLFYDFWLLLHQRSPLINEMIDHEEDPDGRSLQSALAELGSKILIIEELSDVLQVTERFSLQNMKVYFAKEDEDGLRGNESDESF